MAIPFPALTNQPWKVGQIRKKIAPTPMAANEDTIGTNLDPPKNPNTAGN